MTGFTFSRWLFSRLLGLVYLCAYASLIPQIVGLVGRNGILPAGMDDTVLRAVCICGTLASIALIAGVLPIVTVPLLWLGYWWLSNACADFLSYQWDALLLEAGALAILVARPVWWDRMADRVDPSRPAVWLMWWLLFRLMFGSGAVKLASGDPTWRDLTAMTFHYETQPIPNPIALYAHQLPLVINKASTAATLAIELATPLMIAGPRRLRLVAAGLFVGLQAVIALTGNFAFFNLLAVALCVWLVDDRAWSYVARAFRPAIARFHVPLVASVSNHERAARPSTGSGRAISAAAAVVVVPVSLLHFTSSLGILLPGWQAIAPIAEVVAPLRSINSYGLFAVMTTTRPEIVIEGSNDGERWEAYEFTYKPGDLSRRPPFVAPHQPRLDWQMWFAALGRYEENVWFQNFCARLLEGSPPVLGLLARDPFGGRPPKYIRAELYRYRFARPADGHPTAQTTRGGDPVVSRAADGTRREERGTWWTRERLGAYSPVLSLR